MKSESLKLLKNFPSYDKKEEIVNVSLNKENDFKKEELIVSKNNNSLYKSEYFCNFKNGFLEVPHNIENLNSFHDKYNPKSKVHESLYKISKFSIVISRMIKKENLYYEPSEHTVKYIIEKVNTDLRETQEYIVLFEGGYKAKVSSDQIVKYDQGNIALQNYNENISSLINEGTMDNDFLKKEYDYLSDDIPSIGKGWSPEIFCKDKLFSISSEKTLSNDIFQDSEDDDIFASSKWKNIGLGEIIFSRAKTSISYKPEDLKKTKKEYKKKTYEFQIRRSTRIKECSVDYKEDKYESLEDLSSENYVDESQDMLLKILKKDKKKSEITFFPVFNDFMDFHKPFCEKCGGNKDLIPCQGCCITYHQDCMGSRTNKVVVLTLIGDGEHVFQCYYCMEMKKSFKLRNRCYICGEVGENCIKFDVSQENPIHDDFHKLKKENQKNTEFVINNSKGLLWRCSKCYRACHFYHLPKQFYKNEESKISQFGDYIKNWTCNECIKYPYYIDKILGWRISSDSKPINIIVGECNVECAEWYREYLVKFKAQSYLRVAWVPGLWLSGISRIKNYFDLRENISIRNIEDVIPEDYCTVEIVFDIKYKDDLYRSQKMFKNKEEEIEAIDTVNEALCKWKGLEYNDVTWEKVPENNSPRWEAFKNAYIQFVESHYIHSLGKKKLHRIMKNASFSDLIIKDQPKYIQGGELMEYQKEGLNWLYYMCQMGRSVILADEMGLGKTIQIISLCSVLFYEWEKWPFLIVAPNSTISNWKREFSKWSPHLHVVPYHGEKIQRDIIRQYRLFHQQSRDLKCHVVLTSYHTIITDSILSNFDWECLIVDEGQRLKNEHSLLFKKLTAYKSQNRIILTGTPLQNNLKELFNLLQFLDPEKFDTTKLSFEYSNMTSEKVTQMHDILRPLLLRRTKSEVLTSLPQKLEIILPVTMSSLQKSLYKLILSKNAKLLMSIMSKSTAERPLTNYNNTALSNILLQLRKVLSHPYVYSPNVEEKTSNEELEYERMVKASAKLEFLSKLFPKLKRRGRRVLVFCQFTLTLDILEDWLNYIGYKSERIDGTTPTCDRQRRIDQFNAKDSESFCFLLSTRAGGVGINLASADTIIIYDIDFNPHQDIQAISRSYRIGQTKNVLVFILITRNTAEEKILEGARRKMVLDHLIIESLDEKSETAIDYQTILSFGAKSLFDDQNNDQEIYYNDNEIEGLLAQSEKDVSREVNKNSADSFSFAKVWEYSMLNKSNENSEDNAKSKIADIDFWNKIVNENNMENISDNSNMEIGMRGRKRKKINYSLDTSSIKSQKFKKRTEAILNSSDMEFYENADYLSNNENTHINKHGYVRNKISRNGSCLRTINTQVKLNTNTSTETTSDMHNDLKSHKHLTNDLKNNKQKHKKKRPKSFTNLNIIIDIPRDLTKKSLCQE
ncbi:hypothetical protein PNEG_01867 [Pneumocystis murina B123]|uniref:Uncharacterized protein n=1 Tax=Pneumocystis murina (strain B123) TaxID=1069680 RepID=M7PGU2_PNEMU|nr:hypothetical protein PNEG_01867 [Pneumocystis murina B123]EMR09679.1 hypothetical protein PNEG_01867 [Pneumocystis murina B123]